MTRAPIAFGAEGAHQAPLGTSSAPVYIASTPKGPVCLPDFIKDPRFFEEPELLPLLTAIETAQEKAAREFFQEAQRLGPKALENYLRGPQGTAMSDSDLASWSLYLAQSGPAGLNAYRPERFYRLLAQVASLAAARAARPSAPEWMKTLTFSDWGVLLNNDDRAARAFSAVFSGKVFPKANDGLDGWRRWFAARRAQLDLSHLSYLELGILKEHLLNQFERASDDAIRAEKSAYDQALAKSPAQRSDADREAINNLFSFGLPPRLSGSVRAERRKHERETACVGGSATIRRLSDFTSRYSSQRRHPRHGLPLEFRAGLENHLDADEDDLAKEANALLAKVGDQEKNLLGDEDQGPNGFTGRPVLGIVYRGSVTSVRLLWDRTNIVINRRATKKQELEKLEPCRKDPDPHACEKQAESARQIAAFQRADAVRAIASVLSQYGRELSGAEREQLRRMPADDFAILDEIVHSLGEVPRTRIGLDYLAYLYQRGRQWLRGERPPGNEEFLRALDFLGPGGALKFDPAKLTRFQPFPALTASPTPQTLAWIAAQDEATLSHFALTLTDFERAKNAYRSRKALFGTFDEAYRKSFGQSLSQLFCGNEACDAQQAKVEPGLPEFLAVYRLVRMAQLAQEHPEVSPRQIGSSGGRAPTARAADRLRRLQRVAFEHDLLQAELGRMHREIAACESKRGSACRAGEINEEKQAMWRALYQDLERERHGLESEVPALEDSLEPGAAEELAVVRQLAQAYADTQHLLANDLFAHDIPSARHESRVGFIPEAYEQGWITDGSERLVDIDYPCPGGTGSYSLKGVPDYLLQSPERLGEYLKRRFINELLDHGGFTEQEKIEVLTNAHRDTPKGPEFIWDVDKLWRKFRDAGIRLPVGNSNLPYFPSLGGLCRGSTEVDLRNQIGWIALLRGDARLPQDEITQAERAAESRLDLLYGLDRVHSLDGARAPFIQYQASVKQTVGGKRGSYKPVPEALRKEADKLQLLAPADARERVRVLAGGGTAEKKLYRDLLSYFSRFPYKHQIRQIVYGPSVPPHLRCYMESDVESRRQLGCAVGYDPEIHRLWEATSSEFQEREHALYATGLYVKKEPPSALKARLEKGRQEERARLIGGSGQDPEQHARDNPPGPHRANLDYDHFAHQDFILQALDRFVKKAVQAKDPSEYANVIQAPNIPLEIIENANPGLPSYRIAALQQARAWFLINLYKARRLARAQAQDTALPLDSRLLDLVKDKNRISGKKIKRLIESLESVVLALNASLESHNAIHVDPALVGTDERNALEAQLIALGNAIRSPSVDEHSEASRDHFRALAAFEHDLEELSPTLEQQAPLPSRALDPSAALPTKVFSSDIDLLGLRDCDYFLYLQDNRLGNYHYAGIPPKSQALIAQLSPLMRYALDQLCSYYQAGGEGPPRDSDLDQEIVETIHSPFPGRILHAIVHNDKVRQIFGRRVAIRLQDQWQRIQQAIRQQDQVTGHRRNYLDVPEYRLLSILSGTNGDVPPWNELRVKWGGGSGFAAFLNALPTMSLPDRGRMRAWALGELLKLYPDAGELAKFSPQQLLELAQSELAEQRRELFGDHRYFDPRTGSLAKQMLVLMVSLIDEAGDDQRGADAQRLEMAKGGPMRFSPAILAARASSLRQEQPLTGLEAADEKEAPAHELSAELGEMARLEGEIYGQLASARLRLAQMERYYATSPAAFAQQQAYVARLFSEITEVDTALGRVGTASTVNLNDIVDVKSLSPATREKYRKHIQDMVFYLDFEQNHGGVGRVPISREVATALIRVYQKALHALDRADGRKDQPPVAHALPSSPKGLPPMHAMSEPLKFYLMGLGFVAPRNQSPVSVCSANIRNPIAFTPHVIEQELQQWRSQNDATKANAELIGIHPQLPEAIRGIETTVEQILALGKSRTSSAASWKSARPYMQAAGLIWGREDLTDPIFVNPELLKNASQRAQGLVRARAALAEYQGDSATIAQIRAFDPVYERKLRAALEAMVGVYSAADVTQIDQGRAAYLTAVHEANDYFNKNLLPDRIDQRIRQLQASCQRKLLTVDAYLRGTPTEPVTAELSDVGKRLESFVNAAVGRSTGASPAYAALIEDFYPMRDSREDLVQWLDKLRQSESDFKADRQVQAELGKLDPALAEKIDGLYRRTIARGEKQLAELPSGPAASLIYRAGLSQIGGTGTDRINPDDVLHSPIDQLDRGRAQRLLAQAKQSQRIYQQSSALRSDVQRLGYGDLAPYHQAVIALLEHIADSPHPRLETIYPLWDKVQQALGKALPAPHPSNYEDERAYHDALDGVLSEYQTAVRHQAESGRALAGRPESKSSAVPPSPVVSGHASGALPADHRQERQLQTLLHLLETSHNAGLTDSQRLAILQRDPAVNDILIQLHEAMHKTLVEKGLRGLPELWKALAQSGSPEDIRQAKGLLLSSQAELEVRSGISPSAMRTAIRKDIREKGKLGKQSQTYLQQLAQIETMSQWLPDRMRELFAHLEEKDARTIFDDLKRELPAVTAVTAARLQKELRDEVATEAALHYRDELIQRFRAQGHKDPERKADATLRLLSQLVLRSPTETRELRPDPRDPKDIEYPGDLKLMHDPRHVAYLAQLKRIYDLENPLKLYLDAAHEKVDSLRSEQEQRPESERDQATLDAVAVAQRTFLPELEKKAAAYAKGGMGPRDAVKKALDELLGDPRFGAHAPQLEQLANATFSIPDNRWAVDRIDTLLQHVAVERRARQKGLDRRKWCEANTRSSWEQWQKRQADRRSAVLNGVARTEWEKFRQEAEKRRDAAFARQARAVNTIRDAVHEIEIITRKLDGINRLKIKQPDQDIPDWENSKKITAEQKARYQAAIDILEKDLKFRREGLEAAYRDVRDASAVLTQLQGELAEKQQGLVTKLTAQVSQQGNLETAKQSFLRDQVRDHDGTHNQEVIALRAARLERYFEWRERADLLGHALAESRPLEEQSDSWKSDLRVKALVAEVKGGDDGCAVGESDALKIVADAYTAEKAKLAKRKGYLSILEKYGIRWNGLAFDFTGFHIEKDGCPPDSGTPQCSAENRQRRALARAAEVKGALTQIADYLPSDSKDPALDALGLVIGRTPWEQFQDRLVIQWNVEHRFAYIQYYDKGHVTDPIEGAAVSVTRNDDGSYTFGFSSLQEERDRASALAKRIREKINQHNENLAGLRRENNHVIWFWNSADSYSRHLEANLREIRGDSDELARYGGIAVSVEDEAIQDGHTVKKKSAPLPADLVAEHLRLEYKHDLQVDVDQTMQNIATDKKWRAVTYAVAAPLIVASLVQPELSPLALEVLQGAALGAELHLSAALVQQDLLPRIGIKSEQTFSQIGPSTFKSMIIFGTGNAIGYGLGYGTKAVDLGASLMKEEQATGLLARFSSGLTKVATRPTSQQMLAIFGSSLATNTVWDYIDAQANGFHYDWGERLPKTAFESAQSAAYMLAPDQAVAGKFSGYWRRYAASLLVNQTISLGMNSYGFYDQLQSLSGQIQTAKKAGDDEKAKLLQKQYDELASVKAYLTLIARANGSDIIGHTIFARQAASGGWRRGVGREVFKTADPATAKPGAVAELRSRAAQETSGPGLAASLRAGVRDLLDRVRGQSIPYAKAASTPEGDAALAAALINEMPQWQLDRVVRSAEGDPKGEARQAIDLIAQHYSMSPERFIEAWKGYRTRPEFRAAATLKPFPTAQLIRQGKKVSGEAQDPFHQGATLVSVAEDQIFKQLYQGSHTPVAEREKLIGELMRLRPDYWNTPIVQANLSLDGLISQVKAGADLDPGQRIIVELMGRQLRSRGPEPVLALLRYYQPQVGETLDWARVQQVVHEASPSNPRQQLSLVQSGRLTVEQIGLLWGPTGLASVINEYAAQAQPSWGPAERTAMFLAYRASGKTFAQFFPGYSP